MYPKVKCSECGKCNKKGKPSVTRGSSYCEKNQTNNEATGFFHTVKENLLKRFQIKNDKNETIQKDVKGFRMSTLKREK